MESEYVRFAEAKCNYAAIIGSLKECLAKYQCIIKRQAIIANQVDINIIRQ